MKKLFYFLVFAVASTALISACGKDNINTSSTVLTAVSDGQQEMATSAKESGFATETSSTEENEKTADEAGKDTEESNNQYVYSEEQQERARQEMEDSLGNFEGLEVSEEEVEIQALSEGMEVAGG